MADHQAQSDKDVERFTYSADAYSAMRGIELYLKQSGLPPALLHLVKLRASQINGCAYCIDMHWKDCRALGESEQRLYSLDAWAECPWYTPRERAALLWTEALTLLREGHVADEVYRAVTREFTADEIADLSMAVTVINGWNRLMTAARTPPGRYEAHTPRATSGIQPG